MRASELAKGSDLLEFGLGGLLLCGLRTLELDFKFRTLNSGFRNLDSDSEPKTQDPRPKTRKTRKTMDPLELQTQRTSNSVDADAL